MTEFVDNLIEVFAAFGPVTAKRMFGGYGLYRDGLMFGLVADDELYLKTDDTSVHAFDALGLPAFEYTKGDKTVKMSYYRAPEEIFDDPSVAREWALRAFDAALRSGRNRGKSTGSRR